MTTRPLLGSILLIAGLVIGLGAFVVTSYSYYILVAIVLGLILALAGIGQLTGGGAPWVSRLFALIGLVLVIGSTAIIPLRIREPDLAIVCIVVMTMAIADFVRSLRPPRPKPEPDQSSRQSSGSASASSATSA